MKNATLLILAALAVLFACTTEDVMPVADFTFRDETTSTFAMGTYDTCSLVSRSHPTHSVHWNLGDGRTSTGPNLILSYDKSGTYSVTLTVTDKSGQSTGVTKEVIVKDRVLKSIDISNVHWKENINGWPPTEKVDIYLQIQFFSDPEMTEGYLCRDCPVLFTSDIVRDVDKSNPNEITIPLNEKFIIDKKLINFAFPENLNQAYLINLMGRDKNGNEYSMQSNRGGGSYFGILKEDFAANEFVIQCGPFSSFKMIGAFE